MYMCVCLQDGGHVVKCIDWKTITDQTRSISPSDYLNEADVLLHTSPYADTVFTAEVRLVISNLLRSIFLLYAG